MDDQDRDERGAAVNLARNGAVAVLLDHSIFTWRIKSRTLVHQILGAVIRETREMVIMRRRDNGGQMERRGEAFVVSSACIVFNLPSASPSMSSYT